MPQLVCANTPHHNRGAVTQGNEHDWLMSRLRPYSPPAWLAVSFWQNAVIMGFSVQEGKIKTPLRLESEGGKHPSQNCLAPMNLSTPYIAFGNGWPHTSWVNVVTPTRALHMMYLFSVLTYYFLWQCFWQVKCWVWIFMVSRLGLGFVLK